MQKCSGQEISLTSTFATKQLLSPGDYSCVWALETLHPRHMGTIAGLYMYVGTICTCMSNSRQCMGVNGEALQLHTVCKKPYFLLQVTRQSVSVLQGTWEFVSGTTSHVRTSECAMGSYDKIIITIVPSYTGKNITCLLPLALLLVVHTRNNTDGNKLMIQLCTMVILMYQFRKWIQPQHCDYTWHKQLCYT